MPGSDPAFDPLRSELFIEYYESLRGHIRETLTRQTLSEFLPPGQLRVLDVGAGDGRDAEWFSLQGHEVVAIDPSAQMIERASERFQAQGLPIETHQLYSTDVEEAFGPATFDVVISHGVLMYCGERAAEHVRDLAIACKPNGMISLLTKGFHGALWRLIDKGLIQDTQDLLRTGYVPNNLGLTTLPLTPEGLSELLQLHNLSILDWRGVRIAANETDGKLIRDMSEEELGDALALEMELGRNPKTKFMGQMLHFIARPN